jgi:glycosyltransferase involved in cell wall biosynthesis
LPAGRFEVVVNPSIPQVTHLASGGPASLEERPPALLTVARSIEQKGVLDLLDAYAMLQRQRPTRLMIYGIEPVEDGLRRRIRLLGLDESVDLLGYVPGADSDRAYREATVFVLPTYFAEGFPLSVVEAMSYGLPVVTNAIRGCVDCLVEGMNAFFVSPHNSEALARRLLELLDDDGLRPRMGEANLAKVDDFAPGAVVPRHAEILSSVVVDRPERV